MLQTRNGEIMLKLVYLPWAKSNRFEWHRVQDRKIRGLRCVGGWWLLYGPLQTLFG